MQPNILMRNMMQPTASRKKAGSVAKLSKEPSLAFSIRAHIPIVIKTTPPT